MRRVVFPVLWLVLVAVIAVALVKIAFGGGLEAQAEAQAPGAQLSPATLVAAKATINNVVEIKGSIRDDPPAPVLSTAAGEVVHLYVANGAKVKQGDPLLQIRSAPTENPVNSGTDAPGDADPEQPTQSQAQPKYRYLDVLAADSGVLNNFSVLLEQQLSVGQNLGAITPQTLSAEGTMSADQQFRLLQKPTTAMVTASSGPAPFNCIEVVIGNAGLPSESGALGGSGAESSGSAAGGAGAGAVGAGGGGDAAQSAASGKVTCKIPAGTPVFAGLGATIALTAGTAKDVVAVPLSAVKGSFQSGVIWVQQGNNQAAQERKVELGLNDGKLIEVTKGLAVGETILQYVPGAPGEPQPGLPGMVQGG